MKKFIAGVIVGAVLFTGVQAFAAGVSLVGKKVGSEAELYLDGKRMSDVIVIDGKSYAPLREIAEGVGRSVHYKAAAGDQKAVVNLSAGKFAQEQRIKELQAQIKQLENQVAGLKADGDELKEYFGQKAEANPDLKEEVDKIIEKDQSERKPKIIELEKEIEGLKKELEALESAK